MSSWSQIGANQDRASGMQLNYVAFEVINGEQGVKYMMAEVEKDLHKWEFGVAGYGMGFNPTIYQMQNCVLRKWKGLGN